MVSVRGKRGGINQSVGRERRPFAAASADSRGRRRLRQRPCRGVTREKAVRNARRVSRRAARRARAARGSGIQGSRRPPLRDLDGRAARLRRAARRLKHLRRSWHKRQVRFRLYTHARHMLSRPRSTLIPRSSSLHAPSLSLAHTNAHTCIVHKFVHKSQYTLSSSLHLISSRLAHNQHASFSRHLSKRKLEAAEPKRGRRLRVRIRLPAAATRPRRFKAHIDRLKLRL